MQVDDYIHRKGTKTPTGIIESLIGDVSAIVRWGVQDGREFREEVMLSELVLVDFEVSKPDDILRNQAKKAGAHVREIE